MSGRAPVDGRPLLALDTSTERAFVAVGDGRTDPLAVVSWAARHRHGEELLTRISEALDRAGLGRTDVGGIVVGTGPGAFTGLRVGIATAKALAHGLQLPLVGVASSTALLEAARASGAADPLALLLPAGPSDAVLVVAGTDGRSAGPVRLPGAKRPELPPGSTVLAIDLGDRATPAEAALGRTALEAFPIALLALGRGRLDSMGGDDLAELVPEYVSLPRGVEREAGGVILARS
ncbi:MAG TPA: tRNA (adenosine(37)-N6)-threonylcarbamoyltransferase complex dimerization subunit type 1 TsaB [Candidatus Limnocylindrales bacterium]|nr:tRNA (adenosine(37)-N6)-threonylcarbamoyltransferase complex dimerization subunit type 1 TsaB [Candidatus Limnocylindrales bacterium]